MKQLEFIDFDVAEGEAPRVTTINYISPLHHDRDEEPADMSEKKEKKVPEQTGKSLEKEENIQKSKTLLAAEKLLKTKFDGKTYEELTDEDLDKLSDKEFDLLDKAYGESAEHENFIKKIKPGHVIALLAVLVVIAVIYRITHWGTMIDQSEVETGNYDTIGYTDLLDQILPVMDENGNVVENLEVDNIVLFGNAPFADDRDSTEGLANMIADATGAKVTNLSVSGSKLACEEEQIGEQFSNYDAFSLYWLVCLSYFDGTSDYVQRAMTGMGENLPPEALEVYEAATGLNWEEVDVVAIMYDATDYLSDSFISNGEQPTNVRYFTGNLQASLEVLKQINPRLRVIVLSPTYAYYEDENGDYISSEKHRNERYGTLADYCINEGDACAEWSASFVDNLFGTVTEDNAKDYLTDNIHLNKAGREKVLERFLYALRFYD